uniref:Uncharacterized protein n=1 Tax=Magallana gigas TaxID=29159 RepID=A0A8W8K4R2_MAGGI
MSPMKAPVVSLAALIILLISQALAEDDQKIKGELCIPLRKYDFKLAVCFDSDTTRFTKTIESAIDNGPEIEGIPGYLKLIKNDNIMPADKRRFDSIAYGSSFDRLKNKKSVDSSGSERYLFSGVQKRFPFDSIAYRPGGFVKFTSKRIPYLYGNFKYGTHGLFAKKKTFDSIAHDFGSFGGFSKRTPDSTYSQIDDFGGLAKKSFDSIANSAGTFRRLNEYKRCF